MVGIGQGIARSTDGGATFKIIQSSLSTSLRSVSFSGQAGFACAPGNFMRSPILMQSADGGAHWQNLTRPNPSLNPWAVYAADATHAWVGGVGTGSLFVTSDSGVTWSEKSLPPSPDQFNETVTGIHVIDSSHASVTTDHNRVLYTDKGGDIWQIAYAPTGSIFSLYDIDFGSASLGIAAGLGDVILRTTNGGTSWSEVYRVSNYTGQVINNVAFVDTNRVYAPASDAFLRSDNGGANFAPVPKPIDMFRTSSIAFRSIVGVAAGSRVVDAQGNTEQAIAHTNNRGDAWLRSKFVN
ncbi:MAG: hypothetical protein V1495_03495 [Pseudomonadota bacterium]